MIFTTIASTKNILAANCVTFIQIFGFVSNLCDVIAIIAACYRKLQIFQCFTWRNIFVKAFYRCLNTFVDDCTTKLKILREGIAKGEARFDENIYGRWGENYF